MRIKTKQLIALTCFVALLNSCAFTKHKETAERAVEKFHRQFNNGEFHDIYVQADEGFKRATGGAEVIALFEAVRRKLGTVVNAKSTGWHVKATPGGTIVTLGYDVEFSEGKATEQFLFQVNKDKALLFNYNINSPLLITK